MRRHPPETLEYETPPDERWREGGRFSLWFRCYWWIWCNPVRTMVWGGLLLFALAYMLALLVIGLLW